MFNNMFDVLVVLLTYKPFKWLTLWTKQNKNEYDLPRTNMTGTFGVSKCTSASLCIWNLPADGVAAFLTPLGELLAQVS